MVEKITLDNTRRFVQVENSRTFRNICVLFGLRDKAVLDVGCGYGQYLRAFGTGSVGITTAPEEVVFGKTHGLNITLGNAENMDERLGRFKAIWANNIFEHLLAPHAFLMNLKKFSSEDTLIIIGVPVVPKCTSLTSFSWWRGVLASNHINFFTRTTLSLTVERSGWKVTETRPFIFKNSFFDILIAPFAPHMYVVASNNPSFAYSEKKLHEWKDDPHYKDILSITGQSENV